MGKQKRVENDAPLQSLLSIADLCRVLNLSRPKIYDLIREGLPIIRFGRAVRVSPSVVTTLASQTRGNSVESGATWQGESMGKARCSSARMDGG